MAVESKQTRRTINLNLSIKKIPPQNIRAGKLDHIERRIKLDYSPIEVTCNCFRSPLRNNFYISTNFYNFKHSFYIFVVHSYTTI